MNDTVIKSLSNFNLFERNIIDISLSDFRLFINDINKVLKVLNDNSSNIEKVIKIIRNKRFSSMLIHKNLSYLINKLTEFNKIKQEFDNKLKDINIISLNINKSLLKINYKKKNKKDKKNNEDKDDKDNKDNEDKDKNDDDINDEKLVDIGVDDGIFRYLYFIDLEYDFLQLQLKNMLKKASIRNNLMNINEVINILTTHIFSKYKENIYILDMNLQKQALNKYFYNTDDNICSICLVNIHTELQNHHSIYCLNCSSIFCPICYEKIKPLCCICKSKI